MKKIYIFLVVCLASCTPKEKVEINIKTISVENAISNNLDFLDRIEIIPLETTDRSLVKTPKIFKYIPGMNAFLLMDSQQYVFLFKGDGKYISNSSYCRGNGPKEYSIGADAIYNPYSKCIEIYNPMGTGSILSYDVYFNWLNTRNLKQESGFVARSFEALCPNEYALCPIRFEENNSFIRIDSFIDNNEHKQFDIKCEDSNYVSALSMMQNIFSITDSAIYYTPDYMDYHFYTYNLEKKDISAIYKLDFGAYNILKEYLDKQYGKAVKGLQEDKQRNVEIINKKRDYLLSSNYPLPIIRLISDRYIYVHYIINKKPYHLIYNRKSEKLFRMTPDADLNMYRCFFLSDNVLYTILYPYELNKYINESSRRFISPDVLDRIKNIKEEDNPVVVKYILKK